MKSLYSLIVLPAYWACAYFFPVTIAYTSASIYTVSWILFLIQQRKAKKLRERQLAYLLSKVQGYIQ